jgi:ferrous iron transport protein A
MNLPAVSLPLAELKASEQAYLVTLGASGGSASRLASLGFTPGVPLYMMQNYGRGPLLVEVRGTRIALGRSEAQRILVHRSSQHV